MEASICWLVDNQISAILVSTIQLVLFQRLNRSFAFDLATVHYVCIVSYCCDQARGPNNPLALEIVDRLYSVLFLGYLVDAKAVIGFRVILSLYHAVCGTYVDSSGWRLFRYLPYEQLFQRS